MTKRLIYIAAPYTNPDPVLNTRIAVEAWQQLTKAGYVAFVPHISMFLHFVHPKPIKFWYEYDIEIMKRCDMVLRLPGRSAGADKEVEVARKIGMPVFEMTVSEFLNMKVEDCDDAEEKR